jgi:acid phosphatase
MLHRLRRKGKAVAGAIFLGAGLCIAACAGSLSALLSGFTPDPKTVANARPAPPFNVESFRDSAAVKIIAVGDWGTGADFQRRVAARMCAKAAQEKPEFILSLGDNIYNSGVSATDDPQWKTKFEDIYVCEELSIPWYAILGNHDHRGNIQAQIDYSRISPRWQMPDRYYKFTKTSPNGGFAVDVFAIDTDPLQRGDAEFTAKQNQWLRGELSRSTARWKIVMGHHMVRSHGGYGDQDYMLREIKPLLDEFGVDLYICGHDHDLQLLKSPNDRFYCLISGGGGGARNTAFGENTIFASTNGGFHYIAVSASRIYLEFINIEGVPLYAHSIAKEARQ